MISKQRKGRYSPALAVAASPFYGEEGAGGGGSQLFLRAKISSGPWMGNNNLIEKNKLLAVKKRWKASHGGEILTCTCGRCFSLLWRRGCWQRRLSIAYVDQEHCLHVDTANNPIVVSHRMGMIALGE